MVKRSTRERRRPPLRRQLPPMQRKPLTLGDRVRLWRARWRPFERAFGLVFGALALVYGLVLLTIDHDISTHPATAPAEVVDVDEFRKAPDTITVQFETPDGVLQESELEGEGYEFGDRVTVEYDTRDPSSVRIAGDHLQVLYGWVWTCLGAVLVLLGAFSPKHLFRRRR